MTAVALPFTAPWLSVDTDPTIALVVRHALARVGVCEIPLGSNRGPEIDAWNLAAGGKLGDYWCASCATDVWRDSGLPTAGLGKDPSCDELMAWAKKTGRWSKVPSLGAMTFYGETPTDATHVSIIVRTEPAVLVVGGNERWGAIASRNGVAVQLRPEERKDILGYAHPFPIN